MGKTGPKELAAREMRETRYGKSQAKVRGQPKPPGKLAKTALRKPDKSPATRRR